MRGYTLLEVLVVIVIIAALAAIVLPVVISARSRARVTQCGNNLGQIGKATLLYAGDHDGWTPPYATQSWDYPASGGRAVRVIVGRPKEWRQALFVYTRSLEVFWCPSDRFRGDPSHLASDEHPEDKRELYTSYQTFGGFTPRRFGGRNGSIRVGVIQDASKRIYCHDAVWWSKSPGTDLVSHHGSKSNRVYLDGHVAFKPNTDG